MAAVDDHGSEVPSWAMHSALEVMRVRTGAEPASADRWPAHEPPGDVEEVVRAAALMIGGLGEVILEQVVDPHESEASDLVAGSLRRTQRAAVISSDGLPLVAALLIAALVARIDVLGWLESQGEVSSTYFAPVIEALVNLADFVDTVYEQPGLALELLGKTLDDGARS